MIKRFSIASIFVSVLLCVPYASYTIPKNFNETHYCGSGSYVEQSETITYTRKETTEYSIKGDLPNYFTLYGNTNCANIAGAVIIGYYDRLYENLIPDYKTYTQIGSTIRYKMMNTDVQQVVSTLYTLMGTDSNQAGTTYNGFQAGMKAYVENYGYTYATEGLGSLNFDKYKSAVEAEKPVAVFLSTYSMLVSCSTSNSTETIVSSSCSIAHVEVGCGYRIDTYYNASNQIVMEKTYLKVASGLSEFNIAYLCLDKNSTIDKASAIIIN